jgi:hypothetical protein
VRAGHTRGCNIQDLTPVASPPVALAADSGCVTGASAKATTVRRLQPCLALLAAIAVAALAGGCRDEKDVLTAADVREAFAHQGLGLEAYEVGSAIPALGYPIGAEGTARQRVACLIFGDSVTARGYVKRAAKASNISRALQARNVAVLLDPAATPDDVRRTLSAVAELRRG